MCARVDKYHIQRSPKEFETALENGGRKIKAEKIHIVRRERKSNTDRGKPMTSERTHKRKNTNKEEGPIVIEKLGGPVARAGSRSADGGSMQGTAGSVLEPGWL